MHLSTSNSETTPIICRCIPPPYHFAFQLFGPLLPPECLAFEVVIHLSKSVQRHVAYLHQSRSRIEGKVSAIYRDLSDYPHILQR